MLRFSSHLCAVLLLVTSASVLGGCDEFADAFQEGYSAAVANKPASRPNDEVMIQWLYGQRLLLSKTIFGNRIWTVAPGEVSKFAVQNVSQNPADKVWTATVQFNAQAGGRGVAVNGLLRYVILDGGYFRYEDFTPVAVSKFGNW